MDPLFLSIAKEQNSLHRCNSEIKRHASSRVVCCVRVQGMGHSEEKCVPSFLKEMLKSGNDQDSFNCLQSNVRNCNCSYLGTRMRADLVSAFMIERC